MKQQKLKPKKKSLKDKKIKKSQKSNKCKKLCRVRNWSGYNEKLKQRGSLDIWIDESIQGKWYAKPTGKRGAQPLYSDLAILSTLQFGMVFYQRLRQTEGFVKSLFSLMDIPLEVPDYSTLSRRGEMVKVPFPKESKEKLVLILDSCGLRVYRESKWKVRQQGYTRQRMWRKVHLEITPDGEVKAEELTQKQHSR
ncbi:MAG: IS5 family transposase [wastewater metagenome]|nr:IS5 family transposase [Candidatus Loosdrechtia aerotolerans]